MIDTARSRKLKNHQVVGQQYLVGKTVGEGAFAKVKYGEHKLTQEPVAIKFLSKRLLARAGLLDRMDQEIKITKRLHHKHIVEIKDVVVKKEKICIIMEYVNGGTLFDKLATGGQLGEPAVKRILKQLLGALDYCHSQGVFHRDIKPENVLLTKEGDVKLSDFGLSEFKSERDESGFFNSTCGTPNYAAPEVLQQQGYYGAPADVWSLGVVLYVMLVGRLPFADRSLPRLVQKIVSGAFEMPKTLSRAGKDLLQRMLTPNPENRIAIAEILKHPWITKLDSFGAVSDMMSEKNEKKKNLLIGERSSVRKSLYSDSAGENLMKRMKLNSKPTFKSMTDDSAETIALSALEDERIKDNDLKARFAERRFSDSVETLSKNEEE